MWVAPWFGGLNWDERGSQGPGSPFLSFLTTMQCDLSCCEPKKTFFLKLHCRVFCRREKNKYIVCTSSFVFSTNQRRLCFALMWHFCALALGIRRPGWNVKWVRDVMIPFFLFNLALALLPKDYFSLSTLLKCKSLVSFGQCPCYLILPINFN